MKLVWLLFYLLSLGVAWYVGYRIRPTAIKNNKLHVPRDYLIGVNFLLNEETDKAVDVFIKMLEVDSDTVETHWAVGKLFRRRGEVDRAIRIHQNLIARPQLEKIYREQSLYELGQDYLSAGMLDRAERIFLEIANTKSYSAPALQALIDIYQQEKAWQSAIEAAVRYESVTKHSMQSIIAHYYCELAEMLYTQGALSQASENLANAVARDGACARASLLQAKIYMKQNVYELALNHLKQVKSQNANYLAEAIELLALCYEKLGTEQQFITYLQELLVERPRTSVALTLAECLCKQQGEQAAINFVADYIRRYPSLRGLHLLVNLYIAKAEVKLKEDLYILQNLMKKLLLTKPDYQCSSCGFAGKSLHWQCPGCKQWSTVKPVPSLGEEY